MRAVLAVPYEDGYKVTRVTRLQGLHGFNGLPTRTEAVETAPAFRSTLFTGLKPAEATVLMRGQVASGEHLRVPSGEHPVVAA